MNLLKGIFKTKKDIEKSILQVRYDLLDVRCRRLNQYCEELKKINEFNKYRAEENFNDYVDTLDEVDRLRTELKAIRKDGK